MNDENNNQLTIEQILKFEEIMEKTKHDLCTCEDRPVYIGGNYFIIKSTTTYEECKVCNYRRNK